MCYSLFRILVSHQHWNLVLIVPCITSRIPYPLGYGAVKPWRVYMHIYFRWNNSNYKKNKRLIILMLLTSKMYKKKIFILRLISSHPCVAKKIILHLISSHPRVYFFLFYHLISSHPKCEEKLFLEKYEKCLQTRFFLFLGLCKFPPEIQKNFQKNIRDF